MKSKLKNTYLNRIAFLIAVLSVSLSSFAQDIKVTAKLDTNSILIGQQAKLQLSIQYKGDKGKQIKIKWPEINNDTIRKEIEVVNQSKIDTVIDKNNIVQFTQNKTLYLTSFDSGYWAIPPMKFIVDNDSNGLFTQALLLQVGTIPVDTTKSIKEIKAPYAETYTWMDWFKDNIYWFYGGLAAIIIILLIIYLTKKYAKEKPVIPVIETPKIPAHIIALEKLNKLKDEKLWQEGKLKQYHSALSEIIREYIENRFKISALEQTTDEILYGFRNVAIDEESRTKLKQLLIAADLVKFAKDQPLATENELSMTNAYDFINGTMREEENLNKKQ